MYTLEYFAVKGRAQPIRYIFHDLGLEYKEVDVCPGRDFKTWLNVYKPRTPFGEAPVLYDGDFQLAQTSAILRYLGKKHGLDGDTLEDQALVDMVNEGANDLREECFRLIYGNFEEGKEAYLKDKLPVALRHFEDLLNKWGNDYVLKKITYVDYNLFDILDMHKAMDASCLDDLPMVTKFYSKMLNRPGIKRLRDLNELKGTKFTFIGHV